MIFVLRILIFSNDELPASWIENAVASTADTTDENKAFMDKFKIVYAKEYKTLDEDLKKNALILFVARF